MGEAIFDDNSQEFELHDQELDLRLDMIYALENDLFAADKQCATDVGLAIVAEQVREEAEAKAAADLGG
jgi:hypothetical protein